MSKVYATDVHICGDGPQDMLHKSVSHLINKWVDNGWNFHSLCWQGQGYLLLFEREHDEGAKRTQWP